VSGHRGGIAAKIAIAEGIYQIKSISCITTLPFFTFLQHDIKAAMYTIHIKMNPLAYKCRLMP
jgi:hypothetical protein